MIYCQRCNKPVDVAPSRGIKFCSRECRINLRTASCKCGKQYQTWGDNNKNAPKTCGDPKCSQSRSLSQTTRDKIANKLLKKPNANKINGIYHKTCKCGKYFTTKSIKAKCCDECKRFVPSPTIEQCRKGAYASLSNHTSRSTSGLKLGSLIPAGYIANDRRLLDGYEIDYLYDNLAVEYHGAWHYKAFHDHYESTKNRDIIKANILDERKINHYVVGWCQSRRPTDLFFKIHGYYINQLFEEISPFKFVYRKTEYIKEYDLLKRSKGSKGYICSEITNWFHSYRWFQRTSTHELNAIDCWSLKREAIITNRKKYSDLSPANLRRYFLLFDYTPSIFSDLYAKNLASKIDGTVVFDPFAGYGNRLLGVTAANKRYIGYDINYLTVNANNLIIHELNLNASCTRRDSSKGDDILECDGLITCPPYGDKDDYGISSKNDYYDMIRDTFKKIRIKDKGFVIIKPSLVDIDKFEKAMGKIKSSFSINWGGLNRSSHHTVYVI